ncbi:hypothetical protein [Microbacterium sp.]|uniref:hypothetical protein n=1 Tax=Microbacterium sp. TaxID=51671 RepID=UPI0039E659EE
MRDLTATPMPAPSMTVAPELVTPGFVGFAAVAFLVVVVILLVADMNRRIRRVRYREEVRAELDAEEAALGAGRAADTDDGVSITDSGDDRPLR